MDTFALKKAGLKATLPRLRILEILERGGERHLSAEDVYRALLDAGEDVVYECVGCAELLVAPAVAEGDAEFFEPVEELR